MTAVRDEQFWDRLAEKYAQTKIADPGGYERTLASTSALLKPGDRVLELGCGTGTTALRLAGSVQSYLATDISAEMIAIARKKHAAVVLPALIFRKDTAQSLSQPETPFDVVLGFSYLHLLQDLPGTLRRIHDLLVPDGLFISKTPCLGEMNVLIRSVLLPVMRVVGKAPQHVSSFSAAELNEKIRAAGFDILTSESHNTDGKNTRPYIVARKRPR